MANSSGILDKWREYFRSSNSDIFSIIEFAILVAASDFPNDLKLNRDRIAEMLFTCKFTKCFGCDKIELAVPNGNGSKKSDDICKSGIETVGSKDTKKSKVSSVADEDCRDIMEINENQVSNCSYNDAETLTNEIEEESLVFEDVLRIKEVLDNSEEESDGILLDSLRKLQLTPLSVEILKATKIGKSVNALRKHRLKEIRNLVRTLIGDWTSMVDAWVNASAAFAETATESVKTSADQLEEGLPSPPMDEGAFLATPISMELSQFFDGIDENEIPRNSVEWIQKRPRFIPLNHRKDTCRSQVNPNRPQNDQLRRPCRTKSTPQPNVNAQKKSGAGVIRRKPVKPQQDCNVRCNKQDSVDMKIEATKRKLHERYQEAENAKKQRTIQVMELHQLPRNKPNNIRHKANGRL